MQWVIEATDKGVRVTYLGGKSGETSRDRVREISHSELKANPEILLQSRGDLQLRIQPALRTHAAFTQNAGATPQKGPGALAIYRTMGNWVMDSQTSEREYVARAGGQEIFRLARAGDFLQVTPKTSKIALVRGGARSELGASEVLKLSIEELASASLHYGNLGWRFGWILQGAVNSQAIAKLPAIDLGGDLQAPFFKKALSASAAALAALVLLSLIWPASKQDELIPPQLAKIILSAPKHAAAAAAAESAAPATTPAQKKVQQTAVVQAFRAKALQSAVSQLMKGGMTRLLQQSDFVEGHRANTAGQLFSAKSKDITASAPAIGALGTKSVAVASLGGSGEPGSSGKAVGYGKGEHAGVANQGKGFVSMDLANSSVEEGLTKDEVGEVIHRHLSEVRYCYESAMIRTPDVEGKLIVDFVIGGSGVVKTAESKQSTLPDPRLDDCIIRRLLTWKFPNTKGGVDVAVTYPFIFKTLGR
jgi:outer membrane biosynthesis protein TonB